MFDKEFYPTPKELIKKMLERYKNKENSRYDGYNKLAYKSILEPSAGKGDILDFIKDQDVRDIDLNAIEYNPDLQSILREKGYPVLSDDFLEYHENHYWDMIIMNPPFSNGDEHLLHAIKISRNTDIICLLNAETIRNPYSLTRKQLKTYIDEQPNSVEFIQNAFSTAERKTGVEIAIVRLTMKSEEDSFSYDFEKEKLPELDFDFDVQNDALARKDLIGNMQVHHQIVLAMYKEQLKADAKFSHFLKSMTDIQSYYSDKAYLLSSGTDKQKYNHLSKSLKRFMWQQVIKELDVEKYMSAKVRKNFEAFINQQVNVAFTKENVAKFFQMIMNNRVNIWEEAIVDVFDVLTRHSEENRQEVLTWKTNDRYKINRKIILPYWVEWKCSYDNNEYMKNHGRNFSLRHNRNSEYTDISKVLAYISGHTLPHWDTIDHVLKQKFEELGNIRTGDKFDNTCFCGYFDIKFFKKGTVHLYFKDKKLWDEFNMRACAGKGWLPGPEKRQWEEELKRRRNQKAKEKAREDVLKISINPKVPKPQDVIKKSV